jgi:hypothetical protein
MAGPQIPKNFRQVIIAASVGNVSRRMLFWRLAIRV